MGNRDKHDYFIFLLFCHKISKITCTTYFVSDGEAWLLFFLPGRRSLQLLSRWISNDCIRSAPVSCLNAHAISNLKVPRRIPIERWCERAVAAATTSTATSISACGFLPPPCISALICRRARTRERPARRALAHTSRHACA